MSLRDICNKYKEVSKVTIDGTQLEFRRLTVADVHTFLDGISLPNRDDFKSEDSYVKALKKVQEKNSETNIILLKKSYPEFEDFTEEEMDDLAFELREKLLTVMMDKNDLGKKGK